MEPSSTVSRHARRGRRTDGSAEPRRSAGMRSARGARSGQAARTAPRSAAPAQGAWSAEIHTAQARPSASRSRRGASSSRSTLLYTRSCGMPLRADVGEHRVDLRDLLVAARVAGIDHVQQQCRRARLGRVDWKAATSSCGRSRMKPTVSAPRPRYHPAASCGAPSGPAWRTAGRRRRHRAGQGAEKRRLAGVGVADQCK